MYRRSWWVIGLWLLVFGFLLPRATNNSIDVDVEALLGASHPSMVNYHAFKDQKS